MTINKTTITLVVLAGLLMSALSAGIFLSQQHMSAGVAPSAEQGKASDESDDEEDDEGYAADEADVKPDQAGITSEEARAAAEAKNPGTRALEVELESENGTLVYEVEMDNGLEVIVDAANGKILGTEQDEGD